MPQSPSGEILGVKFKAAARDEIYRNLRGFGGAIRCGRRGGKRLLASSEVLTASLSRKF
nr:hypothetical protein [uncultured Campylobacter sp.]